MRCNDSHGTNIEGYNGFTTTFHIYVDSPFADTIFYKALTKEQEQEVIFKNTDRFEYYFHDSERIAINLQTSLQWEARASSS